MTENADLERNIELGLREYWEILCKRKRIFLIVFFSCFLVSFLFVFFVLKVKYRASARVIITQPTVQVMKENDFVINEIYKIANESEIIRSDSIAEDISGRLKDNGEYKVNVAPGEVKAMLGVKQKPNSEIVDISAVSSNRYKAFFVLKALIAVYMEDIKERRLKSVNDMYGTLTKQLAQKRREIEVAEEKLTKFLLDNEIIVRALEVGTSEIETNSVDKTRLDREPQINEKYLILKSQRMDKEAFLKEIKNYRDQDVLLALTAIAKRDPKIVDLTLRDTLYEKERELSRLLITQSEIHPDALAATGEVEEAQKKIAFEVDRAIQSIEMNVKSLAAEERKLREIIDVGLSDKMVEYNTLKRDLEVKKSIHNNFMNELQIINIADKVQNVPFLKIIKAPALPARPLVSKSTYLLVAFLLSLSSAGISVAVMEHINVCIENVEEVEDIMDMKVLATMPLWKRHQEANADKEKTGDIGLVTLNHPKSIVSEAFRMLRTNVIFLGGGKKIKSILITSPNPSEGKSFISANLAIAIASAGEKVVLVDADLRRPMIHKYFAIENKKGLSSYLIGEWPLQDIRTCPDTLERLKVIPSGPMPANPNELLGTSKTQELITALNEDGNFVIVDSSPILAVSDSLVLSAKTDGTILIICASSTTKKSGSRAKLLLKDVGANILGGVLNKIKGAKGGYYYCGNKYYSNET
ncbi:MAG: polysaccharide biosynthesis tyrosine autokinase [Candidatus Omnitrophica bacterium]|nr:polysaccharide biosynthesis tyrosine autokinase [Candidatus Omnitrophota bacterium]MDD5429288.1 polysaccharide biosynthesis tyrosine autokinase [Candidatus Omnitrophota bacterium]